MGKVVLIFSIAGQSRLFDRPEKPFLRWQGADSVDSAAKPARLCETLPGM